MNPCSLRDLQTARCQPCEGGVEPLSREAALSQLAILDGWQLNETGKMIFKSWNKKTFIKALTFCNQIAEVAEAESHHPDMHLTGYRHVRIDITTHAINGLSLNDFILAAKIDSLEMSTNQ